uniref:SEA domain-containing protein n=1 Tax=Branchiostoma floridae TaxID=7739 RepID=C3YHR9_BRAFL|eukprot:XP_002604045.1 hypothetical protein BRAFLDRAFT_71665 [Branchiostoma floridae]
MRPSSGVLYLLLALNMASTAPVPPLARRSIRIEVHYVDVNGDQRDANQAVDTFYNSINALINSKYRPVRDPGGTKMRLSGGVLYLFLALTVVSAAPIHPVGRRSVLVGFKLVDAITWNPRAENNPDKLFALIKYLRDAKMRPSGGLLYLFLALTLVSAAPGHPLARRSVDVDFNIKDVADAATPDSNIKDMMNNVLQEALDSAAPVHPLARRSVDTKFELTCIVEVEDLPVAENTASNTYNDMMKDMIMNKVMQDAIDICSTDLSRSAEPRDAKMRPSGGVLYLLLALTVVSAAPVPPLARRSVYTDFKIKWDHVSFPVVTLDQINKHIDLMNGDVPTTTDEAVLRTDVTGSGNDDTADVTSPGPGDADPGGASTNSATLS